VAIITIGTSAIGYIIHVENDHEVSIIERDRSIRQRDSIISQMGVHYEEFIEFKKTYYEKVRNDRAGLEKLDDRLDNMETRETKTETKFEDFLYYKSKK